MDHIPIPDLEAELGCFDQELIDTGPREDHGDSDKFFEAPAKATSRLAPPSKTNSVYPFGKDGTLVWATPAGELLQCASCIGNNLTGVEYRKGIERGKDYWSRGKMLETAVNLPQGSGNGIGLSLNLNLRPTSVHWVHNRWPRFIYQSGSMEIRLQYYVSSQSVVQQYQIRNNGHEEASLPYTISTDVLFRNHGDEPGTFRPIPTDKSSERLLLSQNSEVLIRNEPDDVQFEMAVFLNKQRQTLWAENQPSGGEGEPGDSRDSEISDVMLARIETNLHDKIVVDKRLSAWDEFRYRLQYLRCLQPSPGPQRSRVQKRTNFAKFQNTLVVPGGSSQELCAIFQLSGPLQPKTALDEPTSKAVGAQPIEQAVIGQGPGDKREKLKSKIRHEQSALYQSEDIYFDTPDARRKSQVSQLMKKHVLLARACASVGQIKEARYFSFTAYLIAEILYKEDIYQLSKVRFKYAKFLIRNDWYSDALTIMEDLSRILSDKNVKDAKITKLWSDVRIQLAPVYLALGKFSEAEDLYEQAFQQLNEKSTTLNPSSALILERIAWAKINRGKYEQAYEIYDRFLDQGSASHRIILSNLGFIKSRLGQFADAQSFYKRALQEGSSESIKTTNEVFARSGLSACLRRLGAAPESIADLSASSIQYIDVNNALSDVECLSSSFRESPFGFVISRHQETLLSLCSIPVKGKGVSGIMFVDADPLNCAYEGRGAFFQFKFLIQCHQYMNKIHGDESDQHVDAKRIQATCEAHLVWVFEIAPTTDTWFVMYSVSDASKNSFEEDPLGETSISHVTEGAFHFLKLCLYYETWKEKWEFVLGLLHPRLEKWLSYLVKAQHMSNLWVEREEIETLKPQHDSLSHDGGTVNQACPNYHLSDFTLLWLALTQLENLIASIESEIRRQNRQQGDSAKLRTEEVRQNFDSYRSTLSPKIIQSNITNTFKVLKSGVTEAFDNPLLFQRTIEEHVFEIQPTDVITIEASNFGIFDNSQDQVKDAWRETLKLQDQNDITSFLDPRLIALALLGPRYGYNLVRMSEDKIEDALCTRLFAALYDSGFFAQRIVADGPEQMRSWSAVTYESLSILMGSLHEECRLLLPLNHFPEEQDSLRDPQRQTSLLITDLRTQNRRAIKTFSTVNQKNVFDTGFLPDWMYHYPAFIHKQELVINLQEELKQLSSFEGLKSAVDSCKSSKDFSNIRYRGIPFFPGVIDSGVKKLTRPENFFATHQISVESYYDGASFWDKLRKPRTPDQAKKRLIELSSQDKNSALMCWLSSPQQEKPLLLRFLRRHERLGSFFGERADLKGNLWETEFHLGFYRLLDDTANFSSQNRVREMPTLSHTQASRSIAQVGIGFRFIGDLRDRFWSCHFLSSETVGFKGLVRQYFESSETREELYEKQGQRKTLELVYVERALNEMVSSINEILDAFKTELAVPSKGQSFDNYSMLRFHLEAGDILRDVLGQLNFSVKVIEEWEKREDTRGLRSRWSLKDEDRYGEKLKDLTRKSKLKLQQLHLQQSQLGEQQRYAAQRHSDIVSYQQLQEARTSARFAEDVRLFTYVTIIFLPLSFSSSLFSMQATPTAATLAVMGPTTIIALALTILVLANMKLVDRKLSFWVDKANHNAREKMSTSKNSWASDWSKISSELSEAAQLRLTKLDNKQRLSAESKWWYFFFWLYYCLDIPRIHVLRGFRAWQNQNGLTLHLIVMVLIAAPACTLIFIVQVLILMVSDTLKLIWAMFCQLVQKMFSQPQIEQSQARDEKAMERRPKDRSNEKDKDSISRGTTASKISSVQSARRRISRTLYQWLKSPPRPIKDYRQKKYPPAGDQQGNEPKTMDPSDTDTNSESSNASSIHTTELPSDEEDEWTNPTGDGAATDVTTVKPHLNASKIPAEGATVNDSRTNVEDFV